MQAISNLIALARRCANLVFVQVPTRTAPTLEIHRSEFWSNTVCTCTKECLHVNGHSPSVINLVSFKYQLGQHQHWKYIAVNFGPTRCAHVRKKCPQGIGHSRVGIERSCGVPVPPILKEYNL